ncbi:MAG: winged helix-turn-helix domain-containing protein [Candidatus Nitrosopolaris sp.]
MHVISRCYPKGVTITEISKETHTSTNTVYNSLSKLENAGFIIKKKDKSGRGRGRPGAGAANYDDRSFKYHIENRNFALNKEYKYQFAPGYTKYTSDFLYAWDALIEQNQLDDVYSSLIRILRQAMTKITSSGDPILKQLRPDTEKSMLCQFCGVNHDARDFIRATLLHILDQFETSNAFMDFINEKQFISKDKNHKPIQGKSKIEQAKEWLDNLAPEDKAIAHSILEKSSSSIEQLISRVNKLTKQHFEERLMDEQKALSIIANELDIKFDYADKPQYQIQPTPAEINVIKVEQTQTKDGIRVILHRIELATEWIAAFLTVENGNNNYPGIKIGSIATQGDYESKVTSKGPNYRSIKYIKYGAKQYGAVKFEGLPYNEPTIRFEFRLRYDDPTPFFGSPMPSERISSWLFVFEVQIQK